MLDARVNQPARRDDRIQEHHCRTAGQSGGRVKNDIDSIDRGSDNPPGS
ncbi:MAG: hypothetical protein QM757_10070 [Paludibaculum sp.]